MQGFGRGSGVEAAGRPLWEEVWDSPVSGAAGSWQLRGGHIAATEPFGQAGGASVKASLGKGRNAAQGGEVGTENGDKQRGMPGPERDEKVLSMAERCRP